MYLRGPNRVQVGVELRNDLLGAKLVRRVLERPQEHDGDRLRPSSDKLPRGIPDLVVAERRDDVAAVIKALGHFDDPLPRDDLWNAGLRVVVENVQTRSAGDPECVAKTARNHRANGPAL